MAIILRSEKGEPLTHTELDNNFNELDLIPSGKTFPKTKGVGITIDTDSPDFGWHDLTGELKVYGEANDATRDVYRGGIRALKFAENDQAYIDFHMPHDYAPGEDIFIHAHWSHTSTVITGGSITIGFEVMYAKGHSQSTFSTPITVSVNQNVENTQYLHMIAEGIASTPGGSGVLLDTNNLEVDGIIQCRVFFDSNDIETSDASTPDIFIHFVDIHYKSTGLPTKEKSPDFWS